jgi:hypothetical protein
MGKTMKFVPGRGVTPMGAAESMIQGLLKDEHLEGITTAVFACITEDGTIMSTGVGSRIVGLGLTEVLRDELLQEIKGNLGENEDEEEDGEEL